MRKLIVSEWVTLDGVFDGDTMEHWFNPYHSDARGAEAEARTSMRWSWRTTYEMPPHSLPRRTMRWSCRALEWLPKYVVSSTLEKADWTNSAIVNVKVTDAVAS